MVFVQPEFAQHVAHICRTESDVDEVNVLEHEILLRRFCYVSVVRVASACACGAGVHLQMYPM